MDSRPPTRTRPPFILSSADVPEHVHRYPNSTEGMAPSSRRHDLPWSRWWDDIPLRPQGPHDGRPRAR